MSHYQPLYPDINYYQPDGTKVTITPDEAGHLPEAICHRCENANIFAAITFAIPVTGNINFSLAGQVLKFSARRKLHLECRTCERQSPSIDWP